MTKDIADAIPTPPEPPTERPTEPPTERPTEPPTLPADYLPGPPSLAQLMVDLRTGAVTAAELTDQAVERAQRINSQVGAFSYVHDGAAAHAREVDERIASARAGGQRCLSDFFASRPLAGIPTAIKALSQVKGWPYTGGSAPLAGNIGERDDGVVQRLKDAGVIPIGLTSSPEFGLAAYTEPDGLPPARTPWDLGRGAGGSSGGAAAAVASGILSVAHGSDGGGSLRIPAGCCGLVALKGSRGLVSRGSGAADGVGLVSEGALTHSVLDQALIMQVLARQLPGDPYLTRQPEAGEYVAAVLAGWRDAHNLGADRADLSDLPDHIRAQVDAARALTGQTSTPSTTSTTTQLTIGVLTAPVVDDHAQVEAPALAAVERAVGHLKALGHTVIEAPIPISAQQWMSFMPIWAVGALLPLPPQAEPHLTPLTRWLRELGRGYSGEQYAAATVSLQLIARQVAERWQNLDAVISPTLATAPLPVGTQRIDEDPEGDFLTQKAFTPWSSVYNIVGNPAISLPIHRAQIAGRTLPYGVQIAAPRGREARLFRLAAALEMLDPWPSFGFASHA